MDNQQPKKRSLTSVTLGWLAEKVRRTERIKQQLESGTYRVESAEIAEAMVTKKDEA